MSPGKHLTINTALSLAAAILFGFFCWWGKDFIENVSADSAKTEERIQKHANRLTALESESAIRWPWLEKWAERVDKKLDLILERRK